MIKTHMRKAFSMITAIFVIVLMATVSVLVLNLAGKAVQETTTQYRKEQAILYAKSYTEFAVMAATSQDCIQNISADLDGSGAATANMALTGQAYHVDVVIHYIGNDVCANAFGGVITRATSKGGSIIIDTYVHYRDPDHPNSLTAVNWATNPGFTYHRRSLQRL